MSTALHWIAPAERLPDARVLLWLRAPDGSQDWDVGHWTGHGWVLDWCGAAPAGQVLAWAEPAGPDATATPPGSGRDVLDDLHAAAAAKWRGNHSAQRAGLFARAADEVSRLRAALDRVALALEGAQATIADLGAYASSHAQRQHDLEGDIESARASAVAARDALRRND